MDEPELEVVVGGVAEYDQGKAQAMDFLKDSFGFMLCTIEADGTMHTVTLLPQPADAEQEEWINGFLKVCEDAVSIARDGEG